MEAETAHHGLSLLEPLLFLAAAVAAVPLFLRLGLGAVIGYLAAGVAIGPSGLRAVPDPQAVLTLSELGVVLLLFIIGLELKPARLWAMRRDILGLGLLQLLSCGALLAGLGWAAGLPWRAAAVVGAGMALSSTAFAAPLMAERNELASPYGQRAFAILLLQDLAIVPLLALVALLAPATGEAGGAGGPGALGKAGIMLAAVAGVVLTGRYLLNPAFRLLAATGANEIMTAAALLVVLGAAALMQAAGLSMAMGAFLAGVLLAESRFRHELEADIEPFRGLLLGLFFMAVGMGLDLRLVAAEWATVAAAVAVLMAVKAGVIFGLARLTGSPARDALRMGAVLSQGGEFAFVLFAAAAGAHVMRPEQAALATAAVTFSLALTPLVFGQARRLSRPKDGAAPEADFSGARGTALVIGFGRFGQVVAQILLARGVEVTMIERRMEAIDTAAGYGLKIHYGDGARLDLLRAAGAERAALVAVCVDDAEAALRVVDLCREHFPMAELVVRARDREASLALAGRDVAFQVRETFESAAALGRAALRALGTPDDAAAAIEADVRRRDRERFDRQLVEGTHAGTDLIHTRAAGGEAPGEG